MTMLKYEREIWTAGFKLVAGVDEAGRGPLAGPVVAGVVIFPPNVRISGVRDSKVMSPEEREEKIYEIQSRCIAWGVGIVSAQEIDSINILEATKKAALKAIESLKIKPDFIITDALKLPYPSAQVKPIIKGDAKSHTIAAASIIAKVTRDRIMREYHREYPFYNFNKNKGYATSDHIEALQKVGPSTIHRFSFKGVSWFDVDPIKSQTFKNISKEILDTKSANEIRKISESIEEISSFLPECEISILRGMISDFSAKNNR